MHNEQLQAIHEAGLHILAHTGVVFQDDETVRAFAAHGFKVDGARVSMTAEQVVQAIASAPAEFTVAGRSAARNVVVGDGEVVAANGSGAAEITEGSGLRALTTDDVATWVRLCHQLPNVDLLGYLLASAGTAEVDYLHSVHASLTLTDKPYEFPISEAWHLQTAFSIQEILWGADWHAQPRLFVVLNTMSPLIVPQHTCVTARALAARDQPLCVTPCAMGGTTGPATLAGLLALQHAEALAGLVLIQMARPGAPFLYGGFSGSAHLATGDLMVGAPQFWAIAAATVELAKYLGLPVRAGAGVTDAHVLDMQAGIETAMGLATVLDRGVDFILHAGGTVGAINAVSVEKLVIDDEVVGMLRRRPLDIPVDDETLALPVIEAVGPGGSFLSQKHTRRHGRDYLQPSLFNRRPHSVWAGSGRDLAGEGRDLAGSGRDLAADAAVHARALLEAYQAPELDETVRRQLDRYCLEGGARR